MGSAHRMKGVAGLIDDGESKIVVLSAMSGTTNSLVEIANYYTNGNAEGHPWPKSLFTAAARSYHEMQPSSVK